MSLVVWCGLWLCGAPHDHCSREPATDGRLAMGRNKGSHNKAGKHETLLTSAAPPMQFPQEQIRANRVEEGRLYAHPEVAENDTLFWLNEKILRRNLATAREEAGYTQDAMAKALGVSVRTIKRYEIGDAVPDAAKLRMISMITGVSTDWLLGLVGDDVRTLLDCYEFATPTQRKSIVKAAKTIQAGKASQAAAMAEQDKGGFLARLRDRMGRHNAT